MSPVELHRPLYTATAGISMRIDSEPELSDGVSFCYVNIMLLTQNFHFLICMEVNF